MRVLLPLVCLALVLLSGGKGVAEPLQIVSWNTESGDAQVDVLTDAIAANQGTHLWGFSEVLRRWEGPFLRAAAVGEEHAFDSVMGTTGGADRLLVVYDMDRLERLDSFELHQLNPQRRVRSPLVVHFRDRSTDSQFLFMVNHLYRSRADQRHAQSRGLREWARTQTLPLIAVGDYNYDWHFENGDSDHDRGYDELVADDIFSWVRPQTLVPTHCSAYNSVLDFVFVAGAARDWAPSSQILEAQPDYCPDTARQSDHRPLLARFDLARGARLGVRDEALETIARIEDELQELRATVARFE